MTSPDLLAESKAAGTHGARAEAAVYAAMFPHPLLGRLAGLGTPIADPGELTQAEAKRAHDQLKGCADAKALRRLLDNGEVPDGQ